MTATGVGGQMFKAGRLHVGLFSNLLSWPRRPLARKSPTDRGDSPLTRPHAFEIMEPRRLLATSPITLGSVYIEEDLGSDLHGDHFEVQFTGGAPQTELTRLVINGDRGAPGLSLGDVIFDTLPTGLGADAAQPFRLEQLVTANPNARVVAHVNDGESVLTLDLYGFQAGDKLIFSIDVDEIQFFEPGETDILKINDGIDPITSGVEFQGTAIAAHFTAPHYYEADGTGLYWNRYDDALKASGLNLPEDNLDGKRDRSAGGFLTIQQEVKRASLGGFVYADNDNDGVRDAGELGLGGVTVQVIPVDTLESQSIVTLTTAADGSYLATNLSPGTYRVVEVLQPLGYLDGLDTAGTVDGAPVGNAVNPGDRIEQIVLAGGSKGLEYNFGEIAPAELRGNVHLSDADGNCYGSWCTCQALEGVLVQLLDQNGRVVAEDRTDAAGDYEFSGLLPGVYSIVEVTPAGLIEGSALAGTIDGQTRGVVTDPNHITQIILGAGDEGVQYDFCEHLPASLSGHVYHDVNDNGLRETGEEAIAGVTVTLYNSNGQVVAVTTTNSAGWYQFTGLSAGEYRLVENQPSGWLDGQDTPGTIDGVPAGSRVANDALRIEKLRWGSIGEDYNFGEFLPGTLQGVVHADLNRNGLFDGNEWPIAGVKIELLGRDGVVVATTFTNASGEYLFQDIVPGVYAVRETQPDGYFQGGQRAGSHGGNATVPDLISQIPVGSGQHLIHYDFSEIVPASISGLVYVDMNSNSRRDGGETLLVGVTVRLLDAANNVVSVTQTDANGFYQFRNLAPGEYGVQEVQPAGYFQGGQVAGSKGGNGTQADLITDVWIESGEALVEYNFHEVLPAAISGYVFQDGAVLTTPDGRVPANLSSVRDGLRTADDRPLAGVVLELRDGLTGQVITAAQALPGLYPPGAIQAVTDANGFYQFFGLPAGVYAVYEVHPTAYQDGIDTPGTTGGVAFNDDSPELDAIAGSLAKHPGRDAIVRIAIASGETSYENNFSEVLTNKPQTPWDEPPGNLPKIPHYSPAIPPAMPLVLSPYTMRPTIPTIAIYGAGGSLPMSWHLSVVDGGRPRAEATEGESTLGTLRAVSHVSHLSRTQWVSVAMQQGFWIMPDELVNSPDLPPELVFGIPGALPVSGDFNGDGLAEVGIYHEGQWYIDLNRNGRWDEEDLWAQLGSAHDLPVVGDWDGDGKDDIGIFGPEWPGDEKAMIAEPGLPDPHNEYKRADANAQAIPKNLPPEPAEATEGVRLLKHTAEGQPREDVIDHVFRYGISHDVPVAGDWNGDGTRSIGVFRNGTWFLDSDGDGRHTNRDLVIEMGQEGDLPVVGDWDGDGVDQLGVFRDGVWILDTNGNFEIDAQDAKFRLGEAGDLPVVGDWNGDGIDDPAAYRQAS